jgi:hypothetical protein
MHTHVQPSSKAGTVHSCISSSSSFGTAFHVLIESPCGVTLFALFTTL